MPSVLRHVWPKPVLDISLCHVPLRDGTEVKDVENLFPNSNSGSLKVIRARSVLPRCRTLQPISFSSFTPSLVLPYFLHCSKYSSYSTAINTFCFLVSYIFRFTFVNFVLWQKQNHSHGWDCWASWSFTGSLNLRIVSLVMSSTLRSEFMSRWVVSSKWLYFDGDGDESWMLLWTLHVGDNSESDNHLHSAEK